MFYMHKPTLVSEKIVFSAEQFDVKETTLIFPPDIQKIHHNAYLRPIVVVFAITKEYEVYFVKQYRYLIQQETIEAVAGVVEKNESALRAAKRELKEETGIDAGQWELLRNIDMSTSFFRIPVSIFLAKDLEVRRSNPDETEDIQIVKIPLVKAVEKIYTCEINSPATIIGILLVDKLKKQKRI